MRQYDVALSFAGEDRNTVEEFANALHASDVSIFYDRFEQATLWGKDLYQHLQKVYRDQARYCIVFLSENYVKKQWTKHEAHQAQARAFVDDVEYILPVKLDDSEMPGLNPTIGYIDLRQVKLHQLVELTLEKLGKRNPPVARRTLPNGREVEMVEYNGQLVVKGWPKKIESAQYLTMCLVTVAAERIRYGSEDRFGNDPGEKVALPPLCHDCGVLLGQLHVPGCDMEECPLCRGQAISCDCQHKDVTPEDVCRWENQEPPFD